jgi:Fur family ferric uptake transcriptional regulator
MKAKSEKETAREQLTDYLTERKLKKTPERYAVLDKIYSKKRPFDVETLFSDMQEDGYSVSLATIYNTLKLLQDCGLVMRHQFGDIIRYERILGKQFSHYLICTDCGKVSAFSDDVLNRFVETRKTPQFTPQHYSVCIYGKCGKCSKKKLI